MIYPLDVSVMLGPVTLRLAAQWAGVSAIKNYQSFGQRVAPPPHPSPALVDWGHTSAKVLVDG